MILAELTAIEISYLESNSSIQSVSYYEEPIFVSDTVESSLTNTGVSRINVGTQLNLSGQNIKVGIIESNAVRISTEPIGKDIVPSNPTPTERITQNGISLYDYGNVIVVGTTTESSKNSHPNAVANALLSFAPNIILYSCDGEYYNVEAMIEDGVQIISMSVSTPVAETRSDYGYTNHEAWYDHIISTHGVVVIKSAGNNGNHSSDGTITTTDEEGNEKTVQIYGPRIGSPGMAYNVITVGSYNDEATPHTLNSDSSYKNYILQNEGEENERLIEGCEKPDVIAPGTFNGGATSIATPIISGMVALIFELKPSISAFPQATKAIVLASCHRKVAQSEDKGGPETIQEGITDRQGAGAPDAWIMASIVSQGTYGVDTITGTNTLKVHRFVIPKYGSTNMNFSLSWIKDNSFNSSASHNSATGLIRKRAVNMNLSVYRNGTLVGSSNLGRSSTEMAYITLNDNNWDYEFRVTKATTSYTDTVRYGYAYSLNNSYMTPVTEEGIYYIKNYSTNTYLTLNPTTGDTYLNSFTGNDNQKWIVRETSTDTYELLPGYGTIAGKLNEGDSYYGVGNYAELGTDNMNLSLAMHGAFDTLNDGAVAFYYYDSNYEEYYFLNSIDDDPMFSLTYLSNIAESKTWRLEKINYRRGDVNMDGILNVLDVTALQNDVTGTNMSNMQKFLADTNYDGVINVRDVTKLQRVVGGLDIY